MGSSDGTEVRITEKYIQEKRSTSPARPDDTGQSAPRTLLVVSQDRQGLPVLRYLACADISDPFADLVCGHYSEATARKLLDEH